MSIFFAGAFDDHESVVFARDAASGLRAIIAIHSTALGPAVGGCRMWPYRSEEEALADVLRLSRAMSYKNALAGLALGGGKAVILGESRSEKSPELLRAFGRAVDRLGGAYRTAEDVGTSVADMDIIGEETRHALGRSAKGGATTVGDPSPYTARGGLVAMRAAVRHRLGHDRLAGLTVAIQGCGQVGAHLARLLQAEGALLVVADIDPARAQALARETGAVAVEAERILSIKADVMAPCALGAILDDQVIAALNVPIIAGLANNQLAQPRHAALLHDRGIVYVPDYVANAGGIIAIAAEHDGRVDRAEILGEIEGIGATVAKILDRAARENRSTAVIADTLARERLAAGGARPAAARPPRQAGRAVG
ncbi:amino acid dehydrogenase [Rhodospirillum rubrum]|uniref:Leu/Phe/Val dehydrogenase n=1 Tax=Rhodospirillum rubrum TaxID=1085 RepID=UPI0019051DA1|nr:amino acid dehydrogenase [Rhodospirillum rubrum]MBK1665040.1 amino acid dehydrogenase [Rhodospirillum rubrum]MBK1676589.1 amino acid dehydrogenase [Rhodospirillum rubrum]